MKVLLLPLLLTAFLSAHAQNWSSCFSPGQYDVNGKYLGGTEVMSLTPHKGKLYACTSYVCDLNNETYDLSGGSPILVLDSANASWRQEILFDSTLLIPSLKEIVFTKDYLGNPVAPDSVLITGPNNKHGHLFIYSRNDATETWIRDSITTVATKTETRSIGTHYDTVTGHQYVFIGVSNFGIWKGEYNPSLPSKIQWESDPEFIIPANTRVPAMNDVNGEMYIGTTETNLWISDIYRRSDGPLPVYNKIWADTAADGVDIRGFTAVKNPSGAGDDLWFYSKDYFRRLQPLNNDSIVNEMNVSSDLSLESGRVFSDIITAGYNDHQLFWKDPATNDTLMLIGLQAKYDSTWLLSNPYPNIAGRSIDGMFYTRKQDGANITYQLHYILNNTPVVIDTLLAVRTICISPFAADSNNILYAGGYHTNSVYLNNTAWIYRGDFSDFATPVNTVISNEFPVTVFPNPAHQSFTIVLPSGLCDITITDIEGQNFYEGKNLSGETEIDCRNVPAGIYFISIATDGQWHCNKKIVITGN